MENEQEAPDFSAIDAVHGDVEVSYKVVTHQSQQLKQGQGWQSGLCDCHQDCCKSFCCSVCFPCVPFACMADIVDQGSNGACVYCFLYVLAGSVGMWSKYAGWYRGKLRARYGLPEAPLPDCLVHLLCHTCALAQEYRELNRRGYSVLQGWKGRPPAPAPAPAQRAPRVQEPMTRADK